MAERRRDLRMAEMRGRTSWGVAVLAALLAAAACGSGDVAPSRGASTSAGVPAVVLSVLDPSTLPTDADDALELFADLPDEIAGLRKTAKEIDGEVRYGPEGRLFLVVMEASDMGVGDETNAQLLSIEARREDRTVIAQETEQSAPLLYVTGTEGTPPLHFLLWTGPDNPLIFAAGAASTEDLEAILEAFAETAR